PQPHQGRLADAALAAVPAGLTPTRAPSILLDERAVRVRCDGTASPEALCEAQERFLAQTGWRLELALATPEPALSVAAPGAAAERLKMNLAMWAAQEMF